MLKNYLTIAFRNVFKDKVFSAINILGLGIGLAACLLIFQFVSFELSYDSFNEKLERTYRVTNDRFQQGKLIQHGTITYPTIGPTMAKDYDEIENYTRLMPGGDLNVKADDRIFKGDNTHFADEHFFTVFSFPLLAGDRKTSLKDPYTIVLTEKTADRYFGKTDNTYSGVLGKVIYWGLDPQPFKVTGVCGNVPENSHIQFDALVSYATLVKAEPDADNSWQWSDMRHYLVLKPGVDYKLLEGKFEAFSNRYFEGDKVSGSIEKFYLQPLKDAHLFSDYEYDIAKIASGKAVWAMVVVAVFILIIAWINYINLTTSKALERAREVGLRKVMGAVKGQLIRQFIIESSLISALAFVTAIILVILAQSSFNTLVGSNLSWSTVIPLMSTKSLLLVLGLVLAGVLASGFYPAFVLSSYQPITVLKGKFQRSAGGAILRKSLVVFQFTASASLIIGTLIVSEQLQFMNEADLGFNIRNTLIVEAPERTPWDSTFIGRVESYKHALSQLSGVIGVTTTGRLPGDRLGRNFNHRLADQPSDTKLTMSVQQVDYSFFETYGVQVIAGRAFTPADHKVRWQDLNTIVINESAVRLLGVDKPENAIGKEMVWSNNNRKWTIVGVVGDFHQESLRKPREAMVFRPSYDTGNPTSIKLDAEQVNDMPALIAEVEAVYQRFFPDNAFAYFFLEDRYRRQYVDDNRFGSIIEVFTWLAIVISCLGLIGLSSYTAVQRTKEIGIRKVMGASLTSIVTLLSTEFVRLVVVASVLALPIAYFAIRNWLEGYAYRITPGILSYALPIIMILLIAALTMSFHVVKAALTNPVDTLKYE